MSLWIAGAFLVGYGLAMLTTIGGPVSLAMARRRGFWVGWEAREHFPADAPPRTRREVSQLLAQDEQRMLDGDV